MTITTLDRHAISTAATTLGRAFATDPLFLWVFPDATIRPAALQRFNRVPVAYGIRYGRVTTAHEGKAVSVWIPPGPGITIPGMIRCGMLAVPFQIVWRPFVPFMGANDVMEKIHKARAPEPHWYLMVLGVDPDLQGQGVGSALVAEGLAQADRAGVPCYLETSERRNLRFYERHGFEILQEASLGKGGPPAWAMRREPRPQAASA
jgi:ribosomal protein S18 acetylase RimI-like enzyme